LVINTPEKSAVFYSVNMSKNRRKTLFLTLVLYIWPRSVYAQEISPENIFYLGKRQRYDYDYT
jgi:predicted transcriptional regulator with HTH domain